MTYEYREVIACLVAQLKIAGVQIDSAGIALERNKEKDAEIYVNAAIATLKNVEHALVGNAISANVVRLPTRPAVPRDSEQKP